MEITVRKELIRCENCKRIKSFYYLSEFMYGKRLVFSEDASPLAFIDLIDDKVYGDYIERIKKILEKNNRSYETKDMDSFIERTFGETCDSIDNKKIEFTLTQKKCVYCGSAKFERNMIEPAKEEKIDLPVISHIEWNKLSDIQKEEEIIRKLRRECLL